MPTLSEIHTLFFDFYYSTETVLSIIEKAATTNLSSTLISRRNMKALTEYSSHLQSLLGIDP